MNISYNSSAATAYTDPGTFGNGWFFSHPYIARESTAVLTSEVVFSDDEENYKYWLILPEGSFEIRLTGLVSPDGHEWTTKINSGISITSTGDTEEWDTFTVTTKDGTEYTFEQGMFGFYNYPERCDSRLNQAQLFWEDMPLRWNITSIADVYGNCITYDYNNYTHYATNSLATRITDPPLENHAGRCYYGISVKLLDYIKLENTHTSLTQNVLINYEDRDDMEWEAAHGHGSSIEDIWDTSYFNYGPTETDYPKRISSVVVNEPKSSGVNTIMYAYKFEYDNAVGYFYTFHRDGSEHEDWNQVPRQMLTDLKLYGSDYVPNDPSIVPIAITSFEYDAFDWDSYSLQDGEVTVPCHPDWEPNYTINALYVGQEYNDVGFSYGVKNIKLPYSGNITFSEQRLLHGDQST